MRDVNILLDSLEDIKLLMQYLYADESHSVIYKNAIDVPLELSMDEELNLWVKNLNYPTEKPTYADYGPSQLYAIVKLLEDEKPIVVTNGVFANRWEEVKAMTKDINSFNRSNRRNNRKWH